MWYKTENIIVKFQSCYQYLYTKMVVNRIYILFFSLIVYCLCVQAHMEEESNLVGTNLESILREVLNENRLLRKQVDYLLHRDIESDISEIKKVLETHTEDITDLRYVATYNL